MTIASEIQRIQTNIANTYTALEEKGATMPATENSANLAATVATISGGGAEVEAKNYTGANISEGDKVWINPYHYEAGTITTTSSYSLYNTVPLYVLDNDVMYAPQAANFSNNLYHKDGTSYTGVSLGFNSSGIKHTMFAPNGNVYAYHISSSATDGLYHMKTCRIDTGLVWVKDGYFPICNSPDLLIKAINSSTVAIVKINPSTGEDITTWDLTSSGITLPYLYASSVGDLNTQFLPIAIDDKTILLSDSNSAYTSAVKQIVLNNDLTITVTSPVISGLSQNPLYAARAYMNGYLFKDANSAPAAYDITDLSNITNKTVDLLLPTSYNNGYAVYRNDKNCIIYVSNNTVSTTTGQSKTLKIDASTRQASEISLDYLALSNNLTSAKFKGISFNNSDISDFYYYNGSNAGCINHLVETYGNNLVSYKSGTITQNTQTGSATENIVAGATGTVQVGAVIEPYGSISITANGTYNVTDYSSAEVTVPNPSTGTLSITSNGIYNVTNYASADVNVTATSETLDVLLSLDACVTGGTEMTEAQLATAMETGLSSVLNASS